MSMGESLLQHLHAISSAPRVSRPNLPLQLTMRPVTALASTALAGVVYSGEPPY